jgi:hypothetical protein
MSVNDCTVCLRSLIHGVCPECAPDAFVDALFSMEVSPGQFISPAHYGGWMRRKPVRHSKEKRGAIPTRWRRIVMRADKHKCIHCGAEWNMTFGHVVPWIFGGSDEPCNLRAECRTCNGRQWTPKLASMVEEATCRRNGSHPAWAHHMAMCGSNTTGTDINVDSVWNPAVD